MDVQNDFWKKKSFHQQTFMQILTVIKSNKKMDLIYIVTGSLTILCLHTINTRYK